MVRLICNVGYQGVALGPLSISPYLQMHHGDNFPLASQSKKIATSNVNEDKMNLHDFSFKEVFKGIKHVISVKHIQSMPVVITR